MAGLPTDASIGGENHENNRAYLAAYEKYAAGYRSDCKEVLTIHDKQNAAWTALTNLPPLGSAEDWRAAAAAAGVLPAEFDQTDLEHVADCILAWAQARRATVQVASDRKLPSVQRGDGSSTSLDIVANSLSDALDDRFGWLPFDVFLSHNSKDKPTVRGIAQSLGHRGVRFWLDEDQLVPGENWQDGLVRGLLDSICVAVCIGPAGIGPWQDEEMQASLAIAVREKRRIIPVLLPDGPDQSELPLFLANRTWVDLRSGVTEDGLARLVWGITGRKMRDYSHAIATAVMTEG